MPEANAGVRSPCVGVCALDERDVCIGCYRSAEEIAAWSALSDQHKRDVLERAERRYREVWAQAPR